MVLCGKAGRSREVRPLVTLELSYAGRLTGTSKHVCRGVLLFYYPPEVRRGKYWGL